MPYTKDFANILLNCKRKYDDIDTAFEEAFKNAQEKGIEPFRERNERGSQKKFKFQKNATKIGYLYLE